MIYKYVYSVLQHLPESIFQCYLACLDFNRLLILCCFCVVFHEILNICLTCSSLLFLNISRAFILFWINVRRQQESTRTFSSSICQKQIAFGKNAASHRLDKIRKAEGKSSLRHRSVTCLVPQIYSIPNLIWIFVRV